MLLYSLISFIIAVFIGVIMYNFWFNLCNDNRFNQILLIVFGIFDSIFLLYIHVLLISKLIRLLKIKYEQNISDLIHKLTILTMILLISNAVFITLFISLGYNIFYITLGIDLLINNGVLMLSFQKLNKVYTLCCIHCINLIPKPSETNISDILTLNIKEHKSKTLPTNININNNNTPNIPEPINIALSPTIGTPLTNIIESPNTPELKDNISNDTTGTSIQTLGKRWYEHIDIMCEIPEDKSYSEHNISSNNNSIIYINHDDTPIPPVPPPSPTLTYTRNNNIEYITNNNNINNNINDTNINDTNIDTNNDTNMVPELNITQISRQTETITYEGTPGAPAISDNETPNNIDTKPFQTTNDLPVISIVPSEQQLPIEGIQSQQNNERILSWKSIVNIMSALRLDVTDINNDTFTPNICLYNLKEIGITN